MNILRSTIKTKKGDFFLVDCKFSEKKISSLKIFPIQNGIIQKEVPSSLFENTGPLIVQLEKLIEKIQ